MSGGEERVATLGADADGTEIVPPFLSAAVRTEEIGAAAVAYALSFRVVATSALASAWTPLSARASVS